MCENQKQHCSRTTFTSVIGIYDASCDAYHKGAELFCLHYQFVGSLAYLMCCQSFFGSSDSMQADVCCNAACKDVAVLQEKCQGARNVSTA